MHRITTLAAVAALVAAPVFAQDTAPVASPVAGPETTPAETLALSAPDAGAPTGPVVTFTTRDTAPSFIMTKAATAAFGMLGAFADIAEGERLAKELKLEEPANTVGAGLAAAWASSRGGSVGAPLPVVKKSNLVALNGGKADYIIDVAPVGMDASYFPFDWAHYGLSYYGHVRVFDGKTGKQLSKGSCSIRPTKTNASPNHDQLLGDDAQGLRRLISEANAACVEQMRVGLKLPPPAVATTAEPASTAQKVPATEATPVPEPAP